MTVGTWLLGLAAITYLMVALIVDGGRVLAAVADTSEVAATAARAATTHTDPSTRHLINPTATEAAEGILADEGMTGSVTVTDTRVDVTATATIHLPLLHVIGIQHRTVTSTRSATLLEGIRTP